jgi:hypothetical protein
MASNPVNLSGEPIEVEIGGQSYKLAPVRLRDLLRVKEVCRQRRLQTALRGTEGLLTPDERMALVREMLQPMADKDPELVVFLDSFAGLVETLAGLLVAGQPELSLDQARTILEGMDVAQLEELSTRVQTAIAPAGDDDDTKATTAAS